MKLIPLTQGKFATISDEDYPFLIQKNWFLSEGYPCTMIGRKPIRMHRFILWALMVDHINGDILDNQRENLRPCNKSQNGANSKKRKGELSSRFKGVYWAKEKNKWTAQVAKDSKSFMLGRFDSEIDAALCYDLWALEMHGKFARTNFTPVATNCINQQANAKGSSKPK